jgi:hypothetical protein
MVSIVVDSDEVTVKVLGLHKVWALKGTIRLKRENILAAHVAPADLKPPWLRCPGTCVPWVICAGTYYGKGRKEFWDRTRKGTAIQIDLKNESYTRLVVDVEHPEEIVRELTNAAPGRLPDRPDGVDVTLIRWMLSLSPAERLAACQGAAQSIERLRNGPDAS